MRSAFGHAAHTFARRQSDHAAGATAFLDRDGTINVDTGYVRDADGVALIDGAAGGLRSLRELGLRLIVVSNQSGVARGLMTERDVDAVNERLDTLLRACGVEIDGWFYCPHLPDAGCACRKPSPGLIDESDEFFPSIRARSLVIGDKASDVQLAARAHLGWGGILIDDEPGSADVRGARTVRDLPAAAEIVRQLIREPA